MEIIDLGADQQLVQQTAALLLDSFKEHWSAWSNIDEAVQEVQESLSPEKISRVAIDDNGIVLGWIGGIRQYDGNVWELHLIRKTRFR